MQTSTQVDPKDLFKTGGTVIVRFHAGRDSACGEAAWSSFIHPYLLLVGNPL